ncbi:MAG: ATP-dependent Clp protease ATP-binding subunit ClpX [Candidatus Falkowbacteria bacterium GW2011_GWC2_38_22]|uniref:ATP-dependent Clp protease ATP-binding subunit ClpX n=1 Tax=Candidatus Falkowbacteria bacterium GW2011_GWE1_38_31 TaxID=1618638 RepID=A0A0G0M7I3_9BACT|nr:MAG: ATP-dependent Clp protease ATP-binding subunit ClpX [Candidatus Falkowbacteria bacterium GW2011_GWF2_38_1205]KKQ60662.1 MAG: ATP-dependent Clp protease ATP-binding subunit ClpX [Candidatus Falkowbacteria bacterium GW2011_GWC2_38_22]KKQ62802.1 MAG: ATP-dependent Clp protease ATP-binding subunit ClpX [Candidatus Falkowbacteria bacterium GW2011_GWF1_38_22]KKQ64914.1 MAG: ATP-dependent Clp protease ATP-binding subunit ClpX [Candidatus Falkowbacteria bacterium GW2011_GWE2_38_254]KKQ69634.1 M
MQLEFVYWANCCSFCNTKAEECGPLIRQKGKLYSGICGNCADFISKYIFMKSEAKKNETKDINNLAPVDIDNRINKVVERMNERHAAYLRDVGENIISNPNLTPVKKMEEKKSAYDFSIFPKPLELKDLLDHYIISQETAKRNTTTAIYNHYKRINRIDKLDKNDIEIEKSNILYIGPTGSGKTYTLKIVAKLLNIPFVIVDISSYSEVGYVGDDVENILSMLYLKAEGDKEAAEKGIIFIDEIDKKGKRSNSNDDVSRDAIQQALLKMIEGAKYTVPKTMIKKSRAMDLVEIDTTNILFIFGGAFVGLSDIIKKRICNKSIGFGANLGSDYHESDLLHLVENEDLIKFGMIPEFLGRVPINIVFDELSHSDLLKILTEPKNAIIKQYQELFLEDGINLSFTDDALSAIAEKAIKEKSGARGLRKIMESFMQNIMFEVPSVVGASQCIVSAETVQTGKYDLNFEKESILSKKN